MVHSFNHCKGILSASGSSSSEIVDHGLHKKCNPPCCLDQCDFVSDRNYAILRKICTKIFKEYNRARCREKYTIFDGGNSINVRIHRASSRGDINNIRNEKNSKLPFNKEDNQFVRRPGRVGEKFGFNAAESDHGKSDRYKLQSKSDYTSGQYSKGYNQFVRKPGRVGEKFGFNADDPDLGKSDRYKLQKKNDYTSGQFNKGDNQVVQKPGRVGEKYGFNADDPELGKSDRYKLKKKNDYTSGQFNKADNQVVQKTGRVIEKFLFNADELDSERADRRNTQSKRNKSQRGKGKDPVEDDSFDDVNDKRTKSKSKMRGMKGDDKGYDGNDGETKANRNYNKKNKKGFVNDDDSDESYNEKTGSKKQKSKKGDREKDENIKIRQRKGQSETSEMIKGKKKLKNNYDEYIDDYDYEKDSKKGKNRKEKGVKSKVNKDDILSYDGIEKDDKRNRKKKYLGQRDSDEMKKIDNRKSKTGGKFSADGMKRKEKYHIISDLRDKVRRGEKVGLDGELSFHKKKKSKTSKYQNEQYFQLRKSKPTRVDEAKTCDYLRAQMEERDLCKMCCLQISTCSPDTCCPKLCVPSSKPVMPCF